MIKKNFILTGIALASVMMFGACKKEKSSTTGWNYNDKDYGGFEKQPYKEQETGPNLVYIPGGTLTSGLMENDLAYEGDAVPRKVTIADFYMDETEIRNIDWREYLHWLHRVYTSYPEVEEKAKPDTLVWRDRLAYNEPYVKNYFRHPAYDEYPVVGVTWEQASDYCRWRTDRVNEQIMIAQGYIKPHPQQVDNDNFNTDAYLVGQYQPEPGKNKMKDYSNGGQRPVKWEDGVMLPDYRLPTEAEWEYAALAAQGNAVFENVNERRIYPWDGYSMRKNEGKYIGKMRENYKRGRGDQEGISELPNDGYFITGAVRAYWKNDFGLYGMGGNVCEWVLDVYRPLTLEDASDFNLFRGNVFQKVERDEDGYIAEKDSLGRIKYVDVTDEESANRRNYKTANNIGYKDELSYNDGAAGYESGISTLISDKARVYKGGSWNDRAFWMSPGSRRFLDQTQGLSTLGFRCAMVRVGPSKSKKK